MKPNTHIPSETDSQADPSLPFERQTLTVMAIQEILGLFKSKAEQGEDQEHHAYLKKKPLGLI